MAERKVRCYLGDSQGANTSVKILAGQSISSELVGYVFKRNCTDGASFYVDGNSGHGNYYKLLNPTAYGVGIAQAYVNIGDSNIVRKEWIGGNANTIDTTSHGGTEGSFGPAITASENKTVIEGKGMQAATLHAQGKDVMTIGTMAANRQSNVVNTNTTPASNTAAQQTSVAVSAVSSFKYSEGLDKKIASMLADRGKGVEDMFNHARVFGAPYKFLASADYRPNQKYPYGRKYIENILAEAPIVNFVPGIPSFLPDFSEDQKEIITNFLSSRGEGVSGDVVKKITDEEGRYFDFSANYAEYIKYVNMLCRVAGIYMGLGAKNVPGTNEKIANFDWSKYENYSSSKSGSGSGGKKSAWEQIEEGMGAAKDAILGDYKYLKLYVDPNASFNESSSNNTQASAVANLFDQGEGIMKEVQFLSGGDGGQSLWGSIVGSGGEAASSITDWTTKFFDSNNSSNLSKLLKLGGEHVLTGSNIIMPEIWGDAAYNKSYSFTMKLFSPYGDVMSKYMNLIVPMMHVIPLGMPRQTSANSFTSPFLLKVFSKGWFSCEMGIMDSISIEKGGQGWTVDGLPCDITISFSIKDLYSNLMISKSTQVNKFFHNQGLIEFLAVNCGVDITKPNLTTKLESLVNTIVNYPTDIPTSVYNSLMQSLQNFVTPMYRL